MVKRTLSEIGYQLSKIENLIWIGENNCYRFGGGKLAKGLKRCQSFTSNKHHGGMETIPFEGL